MFEAAVVVFREGLEAFLIVAIMLAYVAKTGRESLKTPIYAGVIVALLISATTGWHVAELAQDPAWEGTLALIAGVMVASFTIYIMKTAKNIRGDIHNRLDKNANKDGALADIGVFAFTILMVAREGMETAMMLGAMSAKQSEFAIMGGMMIGFALVTLIACLWVSQSAKINIKLFLQVSGIFLILFSLHMLLYGLHELSEMNLIPLIGEDANMSFHIASEDWVEGPLATNLITFGMLMVPMLWLGGSFAREKLSARKVNIGAAE